MHYAARQYGLRGRGSIFLFLAACSNGQVTWEEQPLAQQVADAGAPSKPPPTDIACTSDAQCARLNNVCARSVCDLTVGKCSLEPIVTEGTACGEGQLCDAIGRCLPCGADATSTYDLVQTNIFDGKGHGCNAEVCHGSSPGQAMLDLRKGISYGQVFNVAGTLSPMLRVRPGVPAESYLYRKMLMATAGTGVPGGGPMPAGGAPPVPAKLLQGVADWIRAGAAETGFVAGTVARLCEAPCVRNIECTNNNPCDGEEQCREGACVKGTPPDCSDGDVCTADHCDPRTGCESTRAPGFPCGDGGVCDDTGTCKTCSSEPPPPPKKEDDAGALECRLPEVVSGKLRLLWDFPTNKSVTSQPLVQDGVVYATSWNGYVYAIDLASGKERWKLNTNARAVRPGVTPVPDGTLLFADGEAMVWRIDRDGKVLWKSNQQVTGADHVWSNVAVRDNLVFVPIASHTDVPCTKGRTVALDLATGKLVWTRMNVPEGGVCRADTAITCKTSADCPDNGACEDARGGAVASPITVDPDGESIYVNTVGCYTFPQVGDTDAMMKLDAKTGATKWVRRFSGIEQFNYCTVGGKDCRTDADCGPSNGPCKPKANFYDFGFINGPLLLNAAGDGKGGKRRLLVSGNKSATLYGIDPDDGSVVWQNRLLPPPTSPGFAGYGLFNAALTHADGKLFAALYELVPTPTPAPDHLMAFSEVDGKVVWSDDIGRSWSSLTTHEGVLYAGTQTAAELYAYNVKTGARLATHPVPFNVAAAPTVAGNTLVVAYGVREAGGVRAYEIVK